MLWLTLAWLMLSAFSIVFRLPAIQWFALGDTDDNMRMMQVRALLNGQDWFDLRNYRMNPPEGANIHWSHLVDLPLAAIILITKPFVGGMMAEKIAIAVAPLIPLLVAFLGIGATVRRLVHPHAWILAIILFVPQGMMGMFLPTRIDHHGWQLALLAVNLAGLTDPKRARGGLTVGLATAASLAIGLEMLIFLAIAGAQIVLRWVWDDADVRRMRAYGLSLAGGVSFFFLTFASEANWVARCDALTPVWLSVMIVAGAFVTVLSYLPLRTPAQRLGAAAVAGAIIVGGFALVWPQCLGRPEQVSPELERLWLKNITEARPIYKQQWVSFLPNIFLPLLGLVGTIWALMRARAGAQAGIWISLAFMSLLSCLMLVWQTRAGPAAQMVSLAGAVWLAWVVLGNIMASRFMLVRVFGSVAAFLLLSGIALQVAVVFGPTGEVTPFRKKVNRANARCGSLPLLAPIAKLPKATILTFVDLGPRLITVTHHDAISGPYHRNEEAILDLHKAWRGTPDDALAMARKHKATLLLICPDSAESTVYVAESPKGFYKQLADGKVPSWLEPVTLPKSSPFRLWQIKPAAP
jgi:hypothetical protein